MLEQEPVRYDINHEVTTSKMHITILWMMLNGRHDVMVDVMSTVCHDIIDDNCHWFDVMAPQLWQYVGVEIFVGIMISWLASQHQNGMTVKLCHDVIINNMMYAICFRKCRSLSAFICLSVCPCAYLKNYWSDLLQIFTQVGVYPWLGPL